MNPSDEQHSATPSLPSLATLRRTWEPLNEAHRAGGRYSDGVHLRIYRCLSWTDRADALQDGEDDLAFILRMIGFNALWGRVPAPGERSNQVDDFRRFLEQVVERDERNRLWCWLDSRRDLLARIFESRFFHREWWNDPDAGDLRGQDKIAERFPGWLADRDMVHLGRELARRMLLLRGQLVHGNATHGGRTNRASVEPAAAFLDGLVRTCLAILVIDGVHEHDLEWHPVPYPPTSDGSSSPSAAS